MTPAPPSSDRPASVPTGRPADLTADRRLGPYALLVVVGTVLTLVTGAAAFVALAAPAGVLLAVGLRDRRALDVAVASVDAPSRCLEGDTFDVVVDLVWDGAADLDVAFDLPVVFGAAGAPWRTHVTHDPGGHRHRLRITVRAERWGRHALGSITIRARRPHGMLRWDRTIDLDTDVSVLPETIRLDELLAPTRPRVAAGLHRAPVRGNGTDFADLRPYVPGDRLRDLSWTATARSDRPWVVVHHPERLGTVVLLLDAFVEVGTPLGALDRAARVVWSIAGHHLRNGDRVGLLTAGSTPTWLPPAAGRRARWQVLDTLLHTGGVMASGRSSYAPGPDRSAGSDQLRGVARRVGVRDAPLPADAVVVGVTPLQSDAFVAAMAHHVRRGRVGAVVGVDLDDLLPPATDQVERAARVLWDLDVEARRATLRRARIPSVVVGEDVSAGVALLARLRRRVERVPA